jgi:hypothetical protein
MVGVGHDNFQPMAVTTFAQSDNILGYGIRLVHDFAVLMLQSYTFSNKWKPLYLNLYSLF